jgi:hypothetical protein
MGARTTVALAVLSVAALAASGVALALYVTQESDESSVGPVTVTTTTTVTMIETRTRTVRAPSRADRPPPGLKENGQMLWQLEALLRDTFGGSDFYLHYEQDAAWFDQEFTGNCCSEEWSLLFPAATGSDLKISDPGFTLPAVHGASGGVTPLKILDDYIACPDGRWVYTGLGAARGTSHFSVFCMDAGGG